MNIKYKSSILGVIFIYVMSPILVFLLLWVLFAVSLNTKFSSYSIIISGLVWCISLGLLILIIATCIKTRYIKVAEKNIFIKTLNGDKILEYKDVISITEGNDTQGVTICLKYKNNKTGKNYTIRTVPDQNINKWRIISSTNKSDMFNYIQERINIINTSVT